MSRQPISRETEANEQSTAIMTPIHEVMQTRAAPLGKKEVFHENIVCLVVISNR